MKKIGLIGGVGPESTIEYYRLIIKKFQETLTSEDYPELTIHSINMNEMLGYVFTNQLEKLADFMADKIKILELSGVDYAAIASNTPHIVFDKLVEKTTVPLISIVEETCKVISSCKLKHVGLFGTKSTMVNGFYNKVAGRFNFDIKIPDPKSLDYIHSKYLTEITLNKIFPQTKQQLIKIVNDLKEKESIEGLIMGGTELSLILKQSDFNDIEIFDTTKIHVDSIVNKMVEN